jgi:hypothetical protein
MQDPVLWRTTSAPLRSVSCETVAVLRNSRFLALGRTASTSFSAIFSQNSCFPMGRHKSVTLPWTSWTLFCTSLSGSYWLLLREHLNCTLPWTTSSSLGGFMVLEIFTTVRGYSSLNFRRAASASLDNILAESGMAFLWRLGFFALRWTTSPLFVPELAVMVSSPSPSLRLL